MAVYESIFETDWIIKITWDATNLAISGLAFLSIIWSPSDPVISYRLFKKYYQKSSNLYQIGLDNKQYFYYLQFILVYFALFSVLFFFKVNFLSNNFY